MTRAVALSLVLALGGSNVGCGDDERVPEAQPSRWNGPTEGTFDDIPLLPASRPVSEVSEKRDVTAQSYVVRNTTPERVIAFYVDNLEGWTMIGEVEQGDTGDTYRAKWRDEGFELIVSASPAPTLEEPGEVRTQYSLSLSSP